MNMIRAGVVKHPSEWDACGYNEFYHPKQRFRVINTNRLLQVFLAGSDPASLTARTARPPERNNLLAEPDPGFQPTQDSNPGFHSLLITYDIDQRTEH